jgi:hypothetical protein
MLNGSFQVQVFVVCSLIHLFKKDTEIADEGMQRKRV